MYLFSIANCLTVFQIWAKSVKFEPSYDLMRFIKSANFRRVWVGGCVCVCVCVGGDKKSKPSLRVSTWPISLKIVEDMWYLLKPSRSKKNSRKNCFCQSYRHFSRSVCISPFSTLSHSPTSVVCGWVGGWVGCDKKSKPSLSVSTQPISLKIVEDMWYLLKHSRSKKKLRKNCFNQSYRHFLESVCVSPFSTLSHSLCPVDNSNCIVT